ncbi:hypothetical protein ACFFJX_05530 [Pseudarcicella hirudinis]
MKKTLQVSANLHLHLHYRIFLPFSQTDIEKVRTTLSSSWYF